MNFYHILVIALVISIFMVYSLLLERKWKNRNLDARCGDCNKKVSDGDDIHIGTTRTSGIPVEGSPASSKESFEKEAYSSKRINELHNSPLLYDSGKDPNFPKWHDPEKVTFSRFICEECYEKL